MAAGSSATIVILMGMGKLGEIIKTFQDLGKGGIPAAVIQNGTLPEQCYGTGTIDTIQQEVREKKLSSPAVIVVGEVVRHRGHLEQVLDRFALEKAC